jgi:hypothetical protein
MKNFTVTPNFKTSVTEVLSTQKFSAVFPYMNLINREGFVYSEEELNSIVQFLGEFPYSQVAEFFQTLPANVSEVNEETTATAEPTKETKKQKNTKQETVANTEFAG